MPREFYTPLRRDEVIRVARYTRTKNLGRTIEEVAEAEGIMLRIEQRSRSKFGGVAVSEPGITLRTFISVANSQVLLLNRFEFEKCYRQYIILVEGYERGGSQVSLQESFWHEYYHLGWTNDVRAAYDVASDDYLTRGVMYRREEDRADLFAAGVLIDRIEPWDTPTSIAKRCGITRWLANFAIEEHRKSGCFDQTRVTKYDSSFASWRIGLECL